MTKTYTETLAILATAAAKDLESATSLEAAALESLTDPEGPYALEDEPTVQDLIDYAQRTAGSCQHAVALSEAIEKLNSDDLEDTIHTTHTADGRSIDDLEVERIVTRDPLLCAALRGSGSNTSFTRDHEGKCWIWAGHVAAEELGDGTRECRALQDLGVLGSDEPENGEDGQYHVYPLTELGETIRSSLIK